MVYRSIRESMTLMISLRSASLAALMIWWCTGCSSSGGGSNESGSVQSPVQPGGPNEQPAASVTVSGSAQKGPFLIGSSVNVTQLTAQGEALGNSLETATKDSMGNFSFAMGDPGPTLITVNGYHYNELTGTLSDDTLTLRAVYDVSSSDQQSANVNILTHLIHGRVLRLMQEGRSVAEAVAAAQSEWVDGMDQVVSSDLQTSFSHLNLYGGSTSTEANGSNYLLFTSVVFYQHATNLANAESASLGAKLAQVLNTTANDFADNGQLDNNQLFVELNWSATQVDPEVVQRNLENHSRGVVGTAMPVPQFGELIKQVAILAPASDAVITGVTDVTFSIPKGFRGDVYRLLVDGKISQEIPHDRFSDDQLASGLLSISWAPYFWADDGVNVRRTLAIQTEAGGSRVNSSVTNVTVSSNASSALSMNRPLEEQVFTNASSMSLAWSALGGASRYEVQVTNDRFGSYFVNESISATEHFIEGLTEGLYQWRVRAISGAGEVGPWTSPRSFSVTGLPVPSDFSASMEPLETGLYGVTLGWSPVDGAVGYRIEISTTPDFATPIVANDSAAATFEAELAAGEFYWRVASVNRANIMSAWSDSAPLEVGIFRLQLGGGSEERAVAFIRSGQGGYLILGTSNSYEVSPEVDDVDDWVVRVDQLGNITHDYVSVAAGKARFKDIVETMDGSVYMVGTDWDSGEGVVLKLSPQLELDWEVRHRPDGFAGRVQFESVVEWGDSLYVLSSLWWTLDDGSVRTQASSTYKLDPISGSVVAEVALPTIEGARVAGGGLLSVTAEGRMIMAGNASPSVETDSSPFMGGNFLAEMGEHGWSAFWDNIGASEHLIFGYAIEASNSDFIVFGTFFGDFGVARVDSMGSSLDYTLIEYPDFSYLAKGSISATNSGGFAGLFLDQGMYSDSSPLVLVEFNERLDEVGRKHLTDERAPVNPTGVVVDPDGSMTLLFDQRQDSDRNYDIVLRRIPPLQR